MEQKKELTPQEREEMQNQALRTASQTVIAEVPEFGIELKETLACCNRAIFAALRDVSAFDVMEGHKQHHMFVCGILRQISEKLVLLCPSTNTES